MKSKRKSYVTPALNIEGHEELWTTDHREWYRTVYLFSDHWKELRDSKIASVSGVCEHCHKRKPLDVHHVNYRHLFDVELGDLLGLCRACHTIEHERIGRPVRDRKQIPKVSRYTPKMRLRDDAKKRRAARDARANEKADKRAKSHIHSGRLTFSPFSSL